MIDMNKYPRTTAEVSRILPEGYDLVKGGGCFHFDGPDTNIWYSSTVYTHKLSDLTKQQWFDSFEELRGGY